MATFTTSQEWLNQCSLLVEAQPQTTRITCRYSVKPKPPRRVKKTKTSDDETLPDAPPASKTTAAASAQNPRAKLTLKAVDPVSGVCLRYQTTKAAEVSRLVQLLGQLSRRQAGLKAAAAEEAAAAAAEDVAMADAEAATAVPAAPAAAASSTPASTSNAGKSKQGGGQQQQQSGGGGGGGGKGKKKKGKR